MDIDIDHHVNTTSRTVGARTFEAGRVRTVSISRTYDDAIDEVWDAVTNIERIPRWFLPVTGQLRPGGRYQLEGNAGGTINHCEPPKEFDATWEFGNSTSWIEVRLDDRPEGGTRLTLTHIAPVDDSIWDEFGPGALGIGWDGAVLGLSQHLASRAANDRERWEAWATSTHGAHFHRLCGERWHDADVAAGSDPQAARRRADRAIASYSGIDDH